MKSLHIVGIGIKGFNQITLEVANIIKSSEKVFHLTLYDKELRNLNNDTISFVNQYLESESFGVYNEISNQVINSFKSYDNVCLVNYGHPAFLVNITQDLRKMCENKNIRFNIIPGISSIDALWCALNKDSGYPGLQIIEAEVLITRRIKINPKIDLYIPHITEFMIPFKRSTKVWEHPDGIKQIKKCLEGYYKSNHKVSFIAISPIPTIKDEIITIPLSEMAAKENLNKYIRGMTLFIQGDN